MTKPFIKWVGGKRRLLGRLKELMPESFGDYYEPMVGGGALFFGQDPHPHREYVLADSNSELINTYKMIQCRPEELIADLTLHAEAYNSLETDEERRAKYYDCRSWLPSELRNITAAARFIFLNKTGFNGMYRVNQSGGFNVPWGKRARFNFDAAAIHECSQRLQLVDILNEDYAEIVHFAREGDFAYIDPPYIPISPTSKFTEYQPGGFGLEEQERLAQTFRDLDARGVKVMLSNSHSPLVGELYAGYDIQAVYTVHSVAANRSARGRIAEVVVRNY